MWVWIIAGIILLLGGWYWFFVESASVTTTPPATEHAQVTPPPSPRGATGVTVNPPTPVSQTADNTDASNAALDKDMASVDAQMSVFTADNTSIDKSFNDQPTVQAQ